MRPAKLLSMANQIATFFRSYPEEQAVAGVQKHVAAFWTPAMIHTLRTHLDADQDGADPLVVEAVHRRAHAASPVRNLVSPAKAAGQMATDAG